ncbi:MAG: hypothetical protein ACJASX_000919 [Limisphaerales bacterium]|jgi:hypothetical protein
MLRGERAADSGKTAAKKAVRKRAAKKKKTKY